MKTLRKSLLYLTGIIFSVCILGMALSLSAKPAGAEEPPVIETFTLDRVQARIDTGDNNPKSGLRFITAVSEEEYEALSAEYDLEVVTAIIPQSQLDEGEQLTPENPDALVINVLTPVHVGEEYQFRAVLSDKEGSNWNYAEEILAKSVLTVKQKDSETVVTTKETEVYGRNIAYIAYMALEDPSNEFTAEEQEMLNAFVGGTQFYQISAPEGIELSYQYAYEGQKITAAVTVEQPGQKITAVTVNGAEDAQCDLEAGTLSFTMPAAPVTIEAETAFFDNTLEENVLADFKEDYYVNAVTVSGGDEPIIYNENSAEPHPKYVEENMDGALLWVNTAAYGTVKIDFGQKVNIAETGGIYIDLTTNAEFANSSLGIYAHFSNADNAEVAYEKSIAYSSPTIWWEPMRCYFPATLLLSHGVTEIDGIQLMSIAGGQVVTFVEEIGIIPKAADSSELMNFDSAEDDRYYFRWGMTPEQIGVVTEEGSLPQGTDGGALKMSAGHAEQFTVFFKNSVAIEDIESLQIRFYAENADNISDQWGIVKNGIRVWLPDMATDTTTVINAGECTHEPGAEAGWLTYTVSGTALAEMLAGNETLAGLTELSGITIQKLGNQDIYVDSISYTPKA